MLLLRHTRVYLSSIYALKTKKLRREKEITSFSNSTRNNWILTYIFLQFYSIQWRCYSIKITKKKSSGCQELSWALEKKPWLILLSFIYFNIHIWCSVIISRYRVLERLFENLLYILIYSQIPEKQWFGQSQCFLEFLNHPISVLLFLTLVSGSTCRYPQGRNPSINADNVTIKRCALMENALIGCKQNWQTKYLPIFLF